MKLNKKFMSLFAALLVSAGFLAACGNDNNDANDNNEPDTQAEADADEEAEVVSAASVSENPQHLVEMLTNDGSWMFAATADMELEEDLVIQGEHHRRNDPENDLARKLALYASSRDGEETTITDQFTLTVPNIVVKSPNVLLQLGTVEGNVIVEAEGFHLSGTTITGDLIFASQEYMDSASFENGVEGYDYEVQGEIRVEAAE